MTNTIKHDTENSRYEVLVDGVVAGKDDYLRDGSRVVFLHAEISPEFGGRGLGSTLVRAALDDVRVHELMVEPRCPFVRDFIAKNVEYRSLVPEQEWARFGLS